jgi:hypothetical protein
MARQKGNSEGIDARLGFKGTLWQDPVRTSTMQDEVNDARQ